MKLQPEVIPDRPVAVIDIGSNSVRLVVFERASRSLLTAFNEKVLCGLGRNVGSTGHLDAESSARAYAALGRFRLILDELKVPTTIAFATAAVRNARNADAFLREAEAICGVPVFILSGLEEAQYAVKGVIYGCPDATGLVGDLGGGSLELSFVQDGQIEIGETFPLGALALMDVAEGDIVRARDVIDKTLGEVHWLGTVPNQRLYAVGGAWRTLARIHMSESEYALRILQQYTIPKHDFVDIVKLITRSSRRTLEKMSEVPARRVDSLPFSALVMERVLLHSNIEEVVISAYGVREGIVFQALDATERDKDPAVEGLRTIKARFGRGETPDEELHVWMSRFLQTLPLQETQRQRFLRSQAVLLHDIAWADHPDHRALLAYGRVLFSNIAGLDHNDRMYLAGMIFYRYTSGVLPRLEGRAICLSDEDLTRVQVTGSLMRLALTLSGGVAKLLPQTNLAVEDKVLRLSIEERFAALNGDTVEKRLRGLAGHLSNLPDIQVADVEVVLVS